jgi:carbamoyl-phosphate synthase small subunit
VSPLNQLLFPEQHVPAILALADGRVFHGISVGAPGTAVGEVVFNTAMTGYQEILSDPSYARQLVTLTYPHIGNTGCNPADEESPRVHAEGLIIKDLPLLSSNWRETETLPEYLQRHGTVAIAGVETRELTRIVRDEGAQKGCVMAGPDIDVEKAIRQARDFAGLEGMDLAREVTCQAPYDWQETEYDVEHNQLKPAPEPQFHVVCYDYGVKRNILRILRGLGCRVSVVPATTPVSEVLAMQPDGVFLSNGPGDPAACGYAIEAVAELLSQRIPLFGICLGHQLLALASGARTAKMKFGHHGANHPVQNLASGEVMITSQNHGFAVDESSLPAHLRATHKSLFDGSLQGIAHTECPAYGFQGHPEASPGPHDARVLFEPFIESMQQRAPRAVAGESHRA